MKKYMSIKDIVNDDKYPFSLGQLRALITNRHKNGLAISIRKIGRRVYIREDLFDQWMDSHSDIKSANKEEKVNIKLEELNFTARTYNYLHNSGIKTLNDICNLSKIDLMKIRNMGKKSIEEIEDKLITHGRMLREI